MHMTVLLNRVMHTLQANIVGYTREHLDIAIIHVD